VGSLLEQQQLVEPPARRRLVVPCGRSAWWGVDPGVSRVAVAYVTSEGRRGACTASFPDLKGGARLAAIFWETARVCAELMESWPVPGLVWVEQPSGKQPNPALSYAVGAIMGAVSHVVGCPVETVASASWKKSACGRGNIYKPTKDRPGMYGVLVWAQANGYRGSSWDESDALGIAEAARREVALEER
jgi:hypothetical protein